MSAPRPRSRSRPELGVLYCTGRGVGKDLAKAVAWYEKAAQEGHAMAKHNLGVMLIKGMGVDPGPARGALMVQEAAVVLSAPNMEQAR